MKNEQVQKLQKKINSQFKNILESELHNPVLDATTTWSLLSEMLEIVLGKTVHKQWFAPVKPLYLKNNNLVLQTKDHFSASWINTHYQEMCENLVQIQNKKLSVFFICGN